MFTGFSVYHSISCDVMTLFLITLIMVLSIFLPFFWFAFRESERIKPERQLSGLLSPPIIYLGLAATYVPLWIFLYFVGKFLGIFFVLFLTFAFLFFLVIALLCYRWKYPDPRYPNTIKAYHFLIVIIIMICSALIQVGLYNTRLESLNSTVSNFI